MRERPDRLGGSRSQLEHRVIKLFLEAGEYGGAGVREIPVCMGRGARLSPLITIGGDSAFSRPGGGGWGVVGCVWWGRISLSMSQIPLGFV